MSRKRAEQSNEFHDAICAEWEHLDKPRSGQRTIETQLGHNVRVQLSSEIETSFPSLLPTLSTMALGREIIPIGEAVAILYDDMRINGSNSPASLIVVELGDREGPTAKMPEFAFYMYAPQFHWTITIEAKNKPDHFAVKSTAHEQYRFNTQMEKCH